MPDQAQSPKERFVQLIDAHRAPLSRLARYFERNPDKRRDLEQEILLATWRALPSFRGECAERTFMLRIAHNTAARHVTQQVRGRHRESLLEPDAIAEHRADEAPVEARSELRWLQTELRKMDLLTQQVMLLSLEGVKSADIAEITGLSQTAVTSRLSRCRTDLKARSAEVDNG